MSLLDQHLTLRRTVEDYANAREAALTGYASALRELSQVRADLAQFGDLLWPYNALPELTLEDFTQDLDRRLWQLVFDRTEIPRYMDAQARTDFNRSLRETPPAFTVENVRSTLVSAASQVDLMFARGLYDLFCKRPRHLRTNAREPFKLPAKLIWSMMVATDWLRVDRLQLRYDATHKINDLDRVLSTLAGEDFHPDTLPTKINAAWQQSNVYEDAMLKVRGFRNGNLHVWIKRQDVIDKANRVIADYAGPSLAADSEKTGPR
jgi:hypothetical protein